jgi:hypothetical protein
VGIMGFYGLFRPCKNSFRSMAKISWVGSTQSILNTGNTKENLVLINNSVAKIIG